MTDHSESLEDKVLRLAMELEEAKRRHAEVMADCDGLTALEERYRKELDELEAYKATVAQQLKDIEARLKFWEDDEARARELEAKAPTSARPYRRREP